MYKTFFAKAARVQPTIRAVARTYLYMRVISFLGLLFLTPRKNSTARDEFRVLARNTRSHPVLNRLASAQTNPRSAPCQPLRWLAEPGTLRAAGRASFRNHQPTGEL